MMQHVLPTRQHELVDNPEYTVNLQRLGSNLGLDYCNHYAPSSSLLQLAHPSSMRGTQQRLIHSVVPPRAPSSGRHISCAYAMARRHEPLQRIHPSNLNELEVKVMPNNWFKGHKGVSLEYLLGSTLPLRDYSVAGKGYLATGSLVRDAVNL
jgi:hypothetical protein